MSFRTHLSQLVISIIISPIALVLAMPAQADNYGAIAYSQSTGISGSSYDYSSPSGAEARALRECESTSSSGDCNIVISVQNACAALATTPNGAYGSGWGTESFIAEHHAMVTCNQYGQNCTILQWVCTTRD